MSFGRAIRHLTQPAWVARGVFGEAAFAAIEAEITASEQIHGGEIRFAVEGNLHVNDVWRGVTARDRAVEVFGRLGVWDTEANNGVLIYVLWAEHDVEIVADRGFNGKISRDEWATICKQMETLFAANEPQRAVVEGVRSVGQLIAKHFPNCDGNELPNSPVML